MGEREGKWLPEYSETLTGLRTCLLVADRDDTGVKHALAVRDSLRTVGVDAEIVQARTGKDVSDHLAAGHGLDKLVPYVELTREVDETDTPAPATSPAIVKLWTAPGGSLRWSINVPVAGRGRSSSTRTSLMAPIGLPTQLILPAGARPSASGRWPSCMSSRSRTRSPATKSIRGSCSPKAFSAATSDSSPLRGSKSRATSVTTTQVVTRRLAHSPTPVPDLAVRSEPQANH